MNHLAGCPKEADDRNETCDCARLRKKNRQWADSYGSRWYLYRDGKPPLDDDDDYRWNGTQWVREDDDAWEFE